MRYSHFSYFILAISLGTAADVGAAEAIKFGESPRLNDFALYAQRSITLAKDVHVLGGNVGVHLPSVYDGGQINIATGSKIANGGIISPSTTLADNKVTYDFISTNAFRMGTESTSLKSFPGMPGIPFRPAPAAAGTKNVTMGETTTKKWPRLDPGSYGALTMKTNSRLALGPGNY